MHRKHKFKLYKVSMFTYTFRCKHCYMVVNPYKEKVKAALTTTPLEPIFDFSLYHMRCEDYYWWRQNYFKPVTDYTMYKDGKLTKN